MNIIVTGASKGIGYDIIKRYHYDETFNFLALSRNIEPLLKIKDACPNRIHVIPFDLESPLSAYKELANQTKKVFNGIDILINNAGFLANKPFTNLSETDFDRQFCVNVKGPFLLIQTLLEQFRSGSHIVNISSMGGFQGSSKYNGLSLYSASKGALAILTECLAGELAPYNISTNCLALGAVQTEMLAEAFPGYKAPVNPEQMASFILDFAVKGHHVFNGKIIPVTLSNP